MAKLLYTVRNIGEHSAYRKLALEKPAANLSYIIPDDISELLDKYILIEDWNIPGYANTKAATEEFRSELLTILSGESPRWRLWEILVYEEYVTLHYADADTPSRSVTALSLHVSWAPVTELCFSVPQVRIPLNNFKIKCSQADDRHRTLELQYEEVATGELHTESYTCTPLTRD